MIKTIKSPISTDEIKESINKMLEEKKNLNRAMAKAIRNQSLELKKEKCEK